MPEVYDLDAGSEKDPKSGTPGRSGVRSDASDKPPRSATSALPEPAATVHDDDGKSASRIQIGDDTQYKSKRKAPAPPNPRTQNAKAVVLVLVALGAVAFIIYYALAPKRPSGIVTEKPSTATNRPLANMGSPGPTPNRTPINRSYNPGINNMNNPTGRAPGFAPGSDDQRPPQGDGIR